MTAKQEAERAAEIRRVIALLHQWGLHSLGDFARLPRAEVSARLGAEAVRMWERARGQATRLLRLVEPPEVFAESFEFEHEVSTSEPLLFMLRRFLQQFALRLGAQYLVVAELKLRLLFDDRTSYERLFKIPQPSNDEESLFRMLQAHLEGFTSESAIVAVALEAQPTRPVRQQFSLFESALRDPAQLSETLARLAGLLGAERVGTPVLEDTHRPDVFRMEAFRWELPEAREISQQDGSGPVLRRFRHGAAPALREVVERKGPYHASGQWWDTAAWARAEWDVQLASGALARVHEEAGQWQVDGIYD